MALGHASWNGEAVGDAAGVMDGVDAMDVAAMDAEAMDAEAMAGACLVMVDVAAGVVISVQWLRQT